MGKFFIFMLVICCISLASSLELGLSPAKLRFDINGSLVCKKITLLSSDYHGKIEVSDNWKDFNGEYKLNSSQFGLSVFYPKEINFSDGKEVEICISSENKGNYSGIIMFKAASVEIGSLLSVFSRSSNEAANSFSPSPITGAVAGAPKFNFEEALIFETGFLVLILFVIFILDRKRRLSG
jgi:hypothetical protein